MAIAMLGLIYPDSAVTTARCPMSLRLFAVALLLNPLVLGTLFVAAPFSSATLAAEPTLIRYPQQEAVIDNRSDYFLELLALALDKTKAEHGEFRLVPAELGMQQGRALDSLISNRYLNVLWTITSQQRERELRPIRIPLDRGLYGYRVLLIRAEDQARFDAIQTLPALAALTAGQGHDWPDTTILRANGLKVETNSSYISSFVMLARGRFDYFPRGVSEITGELQLHRDAGLAIESGLLLHYPSAMYFFVNHADDALAERLTLGLERALADGSFERLFRRHPAMQDALRLLAEPRRVLELNNPLLPAETPLNTARYWIRLPDGAKANTR